MGVLIDNCCMGTPREGGSDSASVTRAFGTSAMARSGVVVISDSDLIRWAMEQDCEVDGGNPMVEREFSLAQWNNDASSPSSNATSRVALDSTQLHVVMDHSDSLAEVESKFKYKRCCHGKKHASIHNIMHLPSLQPVECSIQDSIIDNRDRAFWERSREVVNDCGELGMSFFESAEQLGEMAERILRSD